MGIGTAVPITGAALEIVSITQAFVPPRMTTTQRANIASPSEGRLLYNTLTNTLNLFTNVWGDIGGPASNVLQVAGDPGSPAEGDIWYDSVTKQFKGRTDTTTVVLG